MWKEGAAERIATFIASEVDEPRMVGSFVVIAETIDMDGEKTISVHTASDQRMTTTFGLLAYATEVERATLFRLEMED